MAPMNLPDLAEHATRYFQQNGQSYGLNSETVRASYVLNTDNFTNYCFHVSDGATACHLKLSDDPEHQKCFRRWEGCHRILEERYRAPEFLGWVDLNSTGCSGPLLKYVPGEAADFRQPSDLLQQVIRMMDKLHADRDLVKCLAEQESEKTYADSFVQTYVEMFRGDLAIVEGNLPDFISVDSIGWMRGEVDRLESMVRNSADFALKSESPIHGDPNPSNVLVASDGQWHVIDRDDLTLGDPAIDNVMLLWPLLINSGLRSAGSKLPIPRHDPRFIKRMLICIRAQVLSGIIDSLADYVECAIAPEEQAQVREMKKKVHEDNLAFYKAKFGS